MVVLLGVGGVLCYRLYRLHKQRIAAGIRAFMWPVLRWEEERAEESRQEVEEVRTVSTVR